MYKIGDKVKIREDLNLKTDEYYGVIDAMLKHKGKVAEIIYCKCSYCCTLYKLDIDYGIYWWSEKMFETQTQTQTQTQNKLIFNNGATILYVNGKKYVSKCDTEDVFDKEKGLLLCIAKSIGYKYSDIENMINNAKDFNSTENDQIKK